MNLENLIRRQKEFSSKAFGEDYAQDKVLNHIKSEVEEVAKNPMNADEWTDIFLLALDGLWRTGRSPAVIAYGIDEKLTINENRDWKLDEDKNHFQHVE